MRDDHIVRHLPLSAYGGRRRMGRKLFRPLIAAALLSAILCASARAACPTTTVTGKDGNGSLITLCAGLFSAGNFMGQTEIVGAGGTILDPSNLLVTQSGTWNVNQAGTWNVGLNAGGNTIGAVTQASGPWTGNTTQWASVALGQPTVYGTAPGAVNVPGVNAFVTNTPSVTQSGTWNVGLNSGSNTIGAVTQASGPWTSNITQWAGGTLGAVSNYGTSPGAVAVPGVNAFVTNSITGTMIQGTHGSTSSPWYVSPYDSTGAEMDDTTNHAVKVNCFVGCTASAGATTVQGTTTGPAVQVTVVQSVPNGTAVNTALTAAIPAGTNNIGSVNQGTPPWSVSQSGNWSVSALQSTNPWVTTNAAIGANNGTAPTSSLELGIVAPNGKEVNWPVGTDGNPLISNTNLTTVDGSAFTAGTSSGSGVQVEYQATQTNNPIPNGKSGNLGGTTYRAAFVNLQTSAGQELGSITGPPLQVALANNSGGSNSTPVITMNAAATAGTTQGYSLQVASTPTIQASAYSANNCIGGFNAIAVAANNAQSGWLTNMRVTSVSGGTETITAYLFEANPSSSTCTDKGTFTLNSADIDKLIAAPFSVVLTAAPGAIPTFGEAAFSPPRPFLAGGSGSIVKTIYYGLVTSAVTPASTSDIHVRVGVGLN